MSITRTFTVAELEDLGAPYDLPKDVEISRTHVDDRRWSSVWELIFRHEGKVWSVLYERGATEHQEVDTWGYDDTVKATLMEPREVTVTKWEPAEEAVPLGRDVSNGGHHG